MGTWNGLDNKDMPDMSRKAENLQIITQSFITRREKYIGLGQSLPVHDAQIALIILNNVIYISVNLLNQVQMTRTRHFDYSNVSS